MCNDNRILHIHLYTNIVFKLDLLYALLNNDSNSSTTNILVNLSLQ